MRKFFLIVPILLLLTPGIAQNLYPKKVNNCPSDLFCLDCGDVKANVDKQEFNKLLDKLNTTCRLNGVKGNVIFQVLLDSTGHGCVLSHTDVTNSSISRNIVKELNAFEGYIPAKTGNKIESRTSFDIVFEISNNKMTGRVQRVDIPAFEQSFDRPVDPEISNKKYTYANPGLRNYTIAFWNTSNSNLPNNTNDNITIDDSLIWLKVNDGLVTFDGNKFHSVEKELPTKSKYIQVFSMDVDNRGVKWIVTNEGIYSFDNREWAKYDSTVTGIPKAFEVVNNPLSGELFFCSNKGLTILKDEMWSTISTKTYKNLPSNSIHFAKRDSKNRLWIGTFSGSAMIDENGVLTSFNDTETILKGKCITSMDEDENGNVYFSLYWNGRTDAKTTTFDEGVGIRYQDGTYKQLTIENSGIPNNYVSQVLYDKNEKILWISSHDAGLIRFDLKDGWENYNNLNSTIPTSDIWSMDFDKNGTLFLATRQGLVKVERIK